MLSLFGETLRHRSRLEEVIESFGIKQDALASVAWCIHIYIYIYTYTYMYICMYIYIYIYR